MAIKAPSAIDVTEYQFKLRSKHSILSTSAEGKSNINLLATASNYGLIFVGDPGRAELKVVRHQNLVDTTEKDERLTVRVVQLPSVPHCIGVSCDGATLAVNYSINGCSFLSFYSVPGFLSAKVMAKLNIRVSPDDNVQVLQILWNPVMPNTLAAVLDNGSLGMYNLKESGFEFHSIDKQERVKCACWSPKGKQIVLGFPGGRLVQYKPDLKVARTIACPENIHQGPFNTVAVQWLSNFQFAVVFLQEREEAIPALHIVNAPKAGSLSYVNYNDISYSQCGPRVAQIFLIHIQPWNILLMTTSNSMEAGILGTKETGDNPTWTQYTTLDEARLELPLTADKQDTFPIGFSLETGCTHQVTVGEIKIPVMPMIHVLSTHGFLVSYDFLNLTPNAPGICCPPSAVADMSGLNLFKPVDELLGVPAEQPDQRAAPTQQVSDITFSVPSGATSTPTLDRKAKPTFGEKPVDSGFAGFGTATSAPSFSSLSANLAPTLAKPVASFGGLFDTTGSQANQATSTTNASTPTQSFASKNLFTHFGTSNTIAGNQGMGQALAPSKSTLFGAPENSPGGKTLTQKPSTTEKSKPLFTIPPTYNATLGQQQQQQQHQHHAPSQEPKLKENKISVASDPAVHDIIKQLVATQIDSFQLELKELSGRSKDIDISIGNMDESRICTKKLNDLQEISDRAAEKDMEFDIQILRHSLTEAFSMTAEVKSKLNFYKNPKLPELSGASTLNQTNRRQMAKLKNLVAVNEAQLQIVQQQVDAQWANYQDLVRQNARRKLHIPGLEAIYQTLTKHEDILAKQRVKIEYIKTKLGVRSILNIKNNHKSEINVESLADSILSMTLADQVRSDMSRLTENKRTSIKQCLSGRKIIRIKPQRPDRVGMNSEVILETKLRAARQREGAVTKPEKMEKMRIQTEQNSIAKPMATKPFVNLIGSTSSLQVKKVEPKPINLSQVPVQSFPQKPALVPAKAPIMIGSGDVQNNPQPVNIFGGGPLSKLSFPSSSSIGFLSGTQSATSFSFKNEQTTPSLPSSSGETKMFQPAVEIIKIEEKGRLGKGLSPFKTDETEVESREKTTSSFAPNTNSGESKVVSAFSFSSRLVDNVAEDKSIETKISEIKAGNATDFSSAISITGLNKNESNVPSQKNVEPNKLENPLSISSPQIEAFSFALKSAPPNTSSVGGGTMPTVSSPALSGFSFAAATSQPISSFSFSKTGDSASTIASTPQILADDVSTSNVASASSTTLAATSTQLGFVTTTPKTTASTLFSSINFGGLGIALSQGVTSQSGEAPIALTNKPTDNTDNLFGNLNICSPPAQDSGPAKPPVSNIFGSALFESTAFTSPASPPNSKSLFGNASPATGLLFSSEAATTSSFVPTPIASTPTSAGVSAPLSLTATAAPVASSAAFGAPSTAPPSTTPAVSWGLGAGKSVFAGTAATTAASIFGGTTTTPSVFGAQTASTTVPFAPATTIAAPLFGTVTPCTSVSPFTATNPSLSSAPLFGTANTFSNVSSGSSIFAGTSTAANSGNIFGGVPKPDQSVFATTSSATPSSLFGGSTAAGTSLFRSPTAAQATSGDTIFGSPSAGAVAFGGQPGTTSSSIFGGSPAVSQPGSLFGAATATANQADSSSGIFGAPTQQSSGAAGGSLFGSSSFGESGQTTGSIFGGGTQAAGAFGGSTFGQASPSPFAGAAQQPSPSFGAGGFGQTGFASGGSVFGGQTTGFNASPSSGSFAQGGPSIAQTGFGSPSAQFAKPTFGGPPTFGSPPSFGAASGFGSAPAFGSPKSAFGGFGTTTTGAFSPPTQKNALFETLGSSDSGLSFGNLAQSSNTNNSKPQFGGSQFSSWR